MKIKLTNVDLNDMTVEEAETLEAYTGMTLREYQKEMDKYRPTGDEEADAEVVPDPPMKLLTPFIWIAGRAENPNFTIDEARKVKMTDLEGAGTGGDPTLPVETTETGKGKGKAQKAKASTES